MVACFCSSSTYEKGVMSARVPCLSDRVERSDPTHRDFKINHLVGKGRHLIAKAELVFAGLLCSEDIISLSLLFPSEHFSLLRVGHVIVDIEGAAGLHLLHHQYALPIWTWMLGLLQSRMQSSSWAVQRQQRNMLSRWHRVCMSARWQRRWK